MSFLRRFWPLLLGLLYLVSPVDVLPDTLLGLGWTDDILVLLLMYWLLKRSRAGRQQQTEGADSNRTGYSTSSESKQNGRATEKDPYEVLGVSSGATWEEIKAAYRIQAQRYHPDRVTHLGEEFQEMAKLKFQEIQRAYETLSRQAGGADG